VASAAPQPCPGNFAGPTLFSRTKDGGKTWEKPRQILTTGVNEQTIGNIVLADRHSGVLYDFFNFIDSAGNDNLEMISSTDRGDTWSQVEYVQRLLTTAEARPPPGCACGVIFPGDESKPLRTGDVIPAVAIDPNSGRLYAVWQDGRPTGFHNDMLLASTSTEGGRTGTWSAPKLVNPPFDKAAFTPGLAVNDRGQVGVIYYDFTPPITRPDILLTDTWFVSTDGPGLDFGPRRLIGGPYNHLAAPFASGFFVGDYEGLTARVPNLEAENGNSLQAGRVGGDDDAGSGFIPLFVMTRCADNTCVARGTLDGAPAGRDSTDAFTNIR
jgi:hypothetical protein